MQRSTVVSLDDALRLTRANTLRSTCYLDKTERLAPNQKRQLQILEEKLFQAKRGLAICSVGQLQKAEGQYTSSEGQIWFYFSEPNRKFILLDFSLSSGGSGGLPIPTTDEDGHLKLFCSGSPRTRNVWVANTYRQTICACSKLLNLSHWFKYSEQRAARFAADFWRRRSRYATKLIFEWPDEPPTLIETASIPLPEWSVLAPFVSAPEQLQNRYARSIIVGEKLCYLAARASFGNLFRAGQDSLRVELFNESILVLEIMFAPEQAKHGALKNFRIAKALPGNALEDDRLLSLLRCELTANLSTFVSCMAGTVPSELVKYRQIKWGHASALKVMKKYALLADFVYLSERLFDTGRPQFDIDSLCEDYKSDMKGRITSKTLREMRAFDSSIHALAAELGDNEKSAPCHADLSHIHRRLLSVTRELFDPS